MKNITAYQIGQSSTENRSKKNYYDWEIWIEEGDLSLNEVEKVEYLLHPTFPNRLRTSTNRSEKFKIKSSGWGEFMIKIMVYGKSGKTFSFTHWLTLGENYTNQDNLSANPKKAKKVFLSFADADARMAKFLESRLSEMGVEVSSSSDIKPGSSIGDYIKDAISSSDAVIAIQPQYESHWQNVEMDIAHKASIKVIPIKNIKRKLASKVNSKLFSMDDSFNEKIVKSITNSIDKL